MFDSIGRADIVLISFVFFGGIASICVGVALLTFLYCIINFIKDLWR